jgi:hypothetical protein
MDAKLIFLCGGSSVRRNKQALSLDGGFLIDVASPFVREQGAHRAVHPIIAARFARRSINIAGLSLQGTCFMTGYPP